ncbi:hypothetical protein LTR91_025843 [Friedmanniomyces endolithicus]|uniref:HypA-like protein n=1 Tax=Friedmanniomyces endolithicus TaxID=329885 RepID=A0AAN6JYY3_9PEZI|nr:hypothetical protein LTR59_017349 [Friedmanniomyces endolithicus]KAK0826078.1 hypothetical protein LTR03_017250 [Friedmanniomyces endolithicus]KAK0860894.1 hypothetical protein LTR87_017156 [Friedmanniomyces endolithicus]KAK0887640.1 hypothetical protein LTR02_017038 [Friedmanniomyces endolithicus]KAK0950202.1 hypothetical protein LTR91_025843 [Friedmanniomyces endolithicus]
MATASIIKLQATQQPEYYRKGINQGTTDKVSALLQKNHDTHHIFFNHDGFHNHIAHHLLTLWALRATDEELQQAYDSNASYQRPPGPLDQSIVTDMHDPAKFTRHLGNERHYHAFMIFFQDQISKSSTPQVINHYLLAGTAQADDLLHRLFSGFLHPLIHLGFALESQQPALVAEALAQAAVHSASMSPFFLRAEQAARDRADEPCSKTIAELLDEIHADPEMRAAPRWSDGNKLRDGVMGRAAERMVSYTSQYRVEPDELERKTAEMVNAVANYTAGAQREGYERKYDFYFSKPPPEPNESHKTRLLTYKIWTDLAMYASRASPPNRLDLVRQYVPKHPSDWDGIFDRVTALTDDDGHAAKLVRALAHGERVCAPWEGRGEFRIKGGDWLGMGHMAVDSVEAGEPRWVRSAGFDEAWEGVEGRAQL